MAESDPERGSAGVVATRFVDLSQPLHLEGGRRLDEVRLAYETYGTLSAAKDNAILVCHALSGDAHAAGWSAEDAPSAVDGIGAEEQQRTRRGLGWWDLLIGPGKAFDTDKYYVICSNIIGSCRGSTGPTSTNPNTGRPYATDFPVITVGDMVQAQAQLIDHLDISRLLAVTGGSLGGMQALEWTIAYPTRVAGCIMTASTARLGTQGVAWNAIARQAIMADPDWQGGTYYGTGKEPTAGIGVARMVGHVTYLSAQAMQDKFDRRLQDRQRYSYTLSEADFAVESYLRYQAEGFARRFDANAYLYISRALTYFDPARTRGQGSLARALQPVQARTLLLSFSSDWLYPPSDSRELAAGLREAGKEVEEYVIDTTYGHDSFLLEDQQQTRYIDAFLARLYAEQPGTQSSHRAAQVARRGGFA